MTQQNDPIKRFASLLQDKTARDIRKAKREAIQATGFTLPMTMVIPEGITGDTPILTIEDALGNVVFQIHANGNVDGCVFNSLCEARIIDPDGNYIVDPDGNYIEALTP